MKQLRIKDNQYRAKEDFIEVKSVIDCVADKTLEQLEHEGVFVFPECVADTKDLTKDQMVIRSYNDSYASGNVMGFLGVNDERIVIKSRFSKGENDFFFEYMLEKVLDFPNFINLQTNANQDEKLFNLLLFLFPRYLRQATRKGLFKTYIRKKYNDKNFRGTINVAEHIKKNTPFIGNVAYSQREYSSDNYLIELIRHTIEYIKGKTCGKMLLNTVKDEVKLVTEATSNYKVSDRRKIIEVNRKNVVRHAYYYEYRALQQLCILILKNEKHQYGNGAYKVYGILFDGAWLWEEYVNSLIGELFYHPMNKAGLGAQRLFSDNMGLIYPDFISRSDGSHVIADAKYKPIDNIGNKDYLQLLAYMFRFDAKKGFYLYPEAGDAKDLLLYLNQGTTYENNVKKREDVVIIKHGLKIFLDASDYADFTKKMKAEEIRFMTIFNGSAMT